MARPDDRRRDGPQGWPMRNRGSSEAYEENLPGELSLRQHPLRIGHRSVRRHRQVQLHLLLEGALVGRRNQARCVSPARGQERTGYAFPTEKYVTRALCTDCGITPFGGVTSRRPVAISSRSTSRASTISIRPSSSRRRCDTWTGGTTTGGTRRRKRSICSRGSHQASASAETSRGNFKAECRFRIAGDARVTTFAPTPYKGAGRCSQ